MIRLLRKKFILASMLAVAILLFLMFGILNVLNYVSMDHYSDVVLENLALLYNLNPMLPENTGQEDPPELPGEQTGDTGDSFSGDSQELPPGTDSPGESEREAIGSVEEPEDISEVSPLTLHLGFVEPEINVNDIMRAAYYTAAIDPKSGETGFIDITHIADITEQEVREKALKLYQEDRRSGWDGACKFLTSEDRQGNCVYIFLDRQPELYNIRTIILISLGVFLFFFGIFILLVFFLSKIMLKPVAVNIEQQKTFVTNAGHEIKTPLAIIQANTEALELFGGENKWTSNIKDQTKRLSVLMNNMLTLAKAQEGMTNQPRTEVDLSALVKDFLNMFTEPAALKKAEFTGYVEDSVIINAVKVQVGQVISIVLDNAVKYCAPETLIEVSLTTKDRNAYLKTENVCTALPECEPERLFDRFFRPDVSRYSEIAGNGIGLSAARAIMESMGGHISCSYGEENRIAFTLVFRH